MKKYFWTILPLILILVALIGGAFIYRAGTSSPLPVEIPEPTLKSTPESTLKQKDLKLQVLNGRGAAGTASEAKDYLEGLGYVDIEIGNANSFDFEETEISLKKDKENYFDLLKKDLSKEYVVSEKRENLEAESKFDAVIIIGNK